MSKCKACGAEIIWIRSSKSGKMIPCDPELIPFDLTDDKERFVTESGDVICGKRLEAPEQARRAGYISHFTTCPHAAEQRRR